MSDNEHDSNTRVQHEHESDDEDVSSTGSEETGSDTSNVSDDDSIVDLSEDHIYQVLSGVFETDKGHNVAEILYKMQKDLHLLATSVHQLIQLSLAANQQQSE